MLTSLTSVLWLSESMLNWSLTNIEVREEETARHLGKKKKWAETLPDPKQYIIEL